MTVNADKQLDDYLTMKEKRPYFDRDFKDHVLERFNKEDNRLSWFWRKPGSGFSYMGFMIFECRLFVFGDYGEAVYNWNSRDLSPRFLMSCNEQYIHSKCTASPTGREFVSFSGDKLQKWLKEQKQYALENALVFGEYHSPDPYAEKIVLFENAETEEKFKKLVTDQLEEDYKEIPHCTSEAEWMEFLSANGDDYFGQDWWEFAPSAGKVPDVQFICQMEGLKRSLEAMEKEGLL